MKKLFSVIISLTGIILLASSVAVLIDHFLSCGYRQNKGYVECGCDPDNE